MTSVKKCIFIISIFFIWSSTSHADEVLSPKEQRTRVIKFIEGVADFDFNLYTNTLCFVRQRNWFPRKTWMVNVSAIEGGEHAFFEIHETTLDIIQEDGRVFIHPGKRSSKDELDEIGPPSEKELCVEKMEVFKRLAKLMPEYDLFDITINKDGVIRVLFFNQSSYLLRFPKDENGKRKISDEYKSIIDKGMKDQRCEYIGGWYWLSKGASLAGAETNAPPESGDGGGKVTRPEDR